MNPILKNILAIIVGVFAGGALNMLLIMVSGKVIPPPEGADLTTMEGLTAAMPLMGPQHFIMPFLAHALGTLVGAMVTCAIAATHKMRFAMAISIWFMIGGILNIIMLPSPLWFTIVDLLLAYLPMGYLGAKLVMKKQNT